VYRRNSLLLELTIKDEDDVAVDVAGCSIFFLVSDTIVKTIENGIVITNPEQGAIEVRLSGDDTNIEPGRYPCELMIIDAVGNRWSKLTYFEVIKNISYPINN
jgi:hypothetical protein